jgi:hypothetical protein
MLRCRRLTYSRYAHLLRPALRKNPALFISNLQYSWSTNLCYTLYALPLEVVLKIIIIGYFSFLTAANIHLIRLLILAAGKIL